MKLNSIIESVASESKIKYFWTDVIQGFIVSSSMFVDLEGSMQQKPDASLIKYRLQSEANLSLKQLAKKLKRDPSTISMVIHGRRKSAPILKAIFEILDPDTAEISDVRCRGKIENKEEAA